MASMRSKRIPEFKAKVALAAELLEGAETLLTELDDEALLKLVALDLEKAGI